jgi:hypothetical protein
MSKKRFQFQIPEFCLGEALGEIMRRGGLLLDLSDAKDGLKTVDVEMELESHNGYEDWLTKLIAKGPQGSAPFCSFCGKGKDEVGTMIQGPSVYICDGCVSVCQEIIAKERRDR